MQTDSGGPLDGELTRGALGKLLYFTLQKGGSNSHLLYESPSGSTDDKL